MKTRAKYAFDPKMRIMVSKLDEDHTRQLIAICLAWLQCLAVAPSDKRQTTKAE